MSAVPVLKPPVVKPEKRRRHRVTSRPSVQAQPRARAGTRTRSRSAQQSGLGLKVTGFVLLACFGFVASSLAGHVMVEKARHEGRQAAIRSLEARRAESILRQQVDVLVSLNTVADWAQAHEFVPPDGIGGEVSAVDTH